MQREGKLTYDGLRAVLRWSPTGVVAYKTEGGGWSVKKDDAVLVNEANFRPRVWKGVLSRNRRKFRQPINVACPSPGRWGRPNSRVTSRHFDHGNASRMSRPDCSGLDGAD